MNKSFIITIGWFLLFGLSTAAMAGERLPIPSGVYYHRFASAVGGAEALWVNPAALGDIPGVNFQLMADYGDGDFGQDWGVALAGDNIGVGFRRLDNFEGGRLDEYVFAVGKSIGLDYHWGGSYRYISRAPGFYNKKHFWNVSLLLRRASGFSYAMVFSNLNRSRVDGRETDIEQLYSISYFPRRIPLVLSLDVNLSTGQNLSEAIYRYGLEISPVGGLRIYGQITSESDYQLGLRINLGRYFIGSQGISDSGGNSGRTAFYAGLTTAQQASLIPIGRNGRRSR